jgi:hypothetical protein
VAKLLVTLLAVVCLSCLATPAQAAERVQVLALMSDDAVPEALALTTELKRAVELEPELSLVEGEYALEVLLVALACPEPPDATCFQRIAAKIGTSNFIWGRVARDGDGLALELHLWQKDHESSRAELRYSPTPDASAHTIAAQAALAKLLAKGDAAAAPDTAAAPATERQAPARAAVASDRPRPSSRASPPIAGYLLLTGGVGLAAGGVYAMLRVHGINESRDFDAYRAGLRQSQDACDEAEAGRIVDGAPTPEQIEDDCRTGKTFQVLQYVLFGISAAATVTGTVLVLTHETSPRSRTKAARPRLDITARGARVTLDVAF